MGNVVTKYRKISLFGYEKKVFTRGEKLETFEIGGIRFGLLDCYDIRFPEISRAYIDRNCSVLLVSSAFPLVRAAHLDILLKARAIENQVYVVSSNRVGADAGMRLAGNSCIVDPLGNAKSLDALSEGCVDGEIEMDVLRIVRSRMTCIDDREALKSVLARQEAI